MYAVIKTGGKQYKVAAGEKIQIEQIAADVGQEVTIDQVLAVVDGSDFRIGAPLVDGATVKATVVAHGRHDKVRIFKMRRRKHYQKHQGHRQNYTELLISQIASELGTFKAEPKPAAAGAAAAQAASSGEPADEDDEHTDGCDVEIAFATPDEALPPARGGVSAA